MWQWLRDWEHTLPWYTSRFFEFLKMQSNLVDQKRSRCADSNIYCTTLHVQGTSHTLHHLVPPCSHDLCMCHDLHPLRLPLQSGPLTRNKNQNDPKRKQNPHPILPSNCVSFCLAPLNYSHGASKPDLEAWAPLLLHPSPSYLYQLWLPGSWKWGNLGNFFWPGNSWVK